MHEGGFLLLVKSYPTVTYETYNDTYNDNMRKRENANYMPHKYEMSTRVISY